MPQDLQQLRSPGPLCRGHSPAQISRSHLLTFIKRPTARRIWKQMLLPSLRMGTRVGHSSQHTSGRCSPLRLTLSLWTFLRDVPRSLVTLPWTIRHWMEHLHQLSQIKEIQYQMIFADQKSSCFLSGLPLAAYRSGFTALITIP